MTTIWIGFLYDLMGRRISVILSFILICLALILIPLSAPSVVGVSLARGLLGIGIQMQLGNPLANDYVKKVSRGKASMWIGAGYVLGETFSMACLFKLTSSLDATKGFAITAAVLGVMGLYVVMSIREHVSSKNSE